MSLSLGSFCWAKVVAKTGRWPRQRRGGRQDVGWGAMDLSERLAKERRARLAAERLLEQRTRELFAANEKLALHARVLSDQIVEQRVVVQTAVTEAETLKGQNTRVLRDLERAHTAAVMAERRLWDSIDTIRDEIGRAHV